MLNSYFDDEMLYYHMYVLAPCDPPAIFKPLRSNLAANRIC